VYSKEKLTNADKETCILQIRTITPSGAVLEKRHEAISYPRTHYNVWNN
jgi:hypothetical protein